MKSFFPRYIINPAAVTKSIWMPEIYQITLKHQNRNYLNSLWIGVGWSVLSLPARIFSELLVPLFNFRFSQVVLSAVAIPMSLFYVFWYGVTGRVVAVPMTIQENLFGQILTPVEGLRALEAGCGFAVIDLVRLIEMQKATDAVSFPEITQG